MDAQLLLNIQPFLAFVTSSGVVTIGLYFIKRRADRLERTFALHREFASLEFIKTRNRAYVLLATNPQKTFMQLSLDNTVQEDFTYLLRLLTFFEHLSISVRGGYIDGTAAGKYFGMVFVWWYVNYFNVPRGLKSTGWELREHIDSLYDFFYKDEGFEKWLANANKGPELEQAITTGLKR